MANANDRGFGLGDLTAPFVWGLNTAAGIIKGGTPNQPGPGRREALLEAGYTVVETPFKSGVVQQWYRPDGTKLPRDQVNPTARQLIRFNQTVNPPLPPGVFPIAPRAGTQVPPKAPFPPPGYNPVLTPPVPYEPPPPPPTTPRPGTPDFRPGANVGGGIGPILPVIDVVSVLERLASYNYILNGVFDTAFGRPQAPIPKGPTTRPQVGQPGRGNPFPPQGPQVIKVYQMPTPPRQTTDEWLSGQGLGRVSVTAKRVPVPKAPAPRPAPPPPKPLWQRLLPLLTPLMGLFGGTKSQSQRQVVMNPFGPGTQPDPRLEPQPSVIFGDIGGREGGGVGSFTCECLPPKKKRRKKKRTVCYTGTYTERADGTRKLKKRKVPCK